MLRFKGTRSIHFVFCYFLAFLHAVACDRRTKKTFVNKTTRINFGARNRQVRLTEEEAKRDRLSENGLTKTFKRIWFVRQTTLLAAREAHRERRFAHAARRNIHEQKKKTWEQNEDDN